MKKIVITGGHLTPALATIEKLRTKDRWEIYYFGRKYALEGKKIASEESKIIPRMGAKFISINPGRLQRKFTRYTIPSLTRIPLSFFQSLFLLGKVRPDVILSFGSYVSVPVVISGWLLGIPIISHEQTVSRGLANRINSLFSKKIAVSYRQSLPLFSKNKVVLTGNPARSQLLKPPNTKFSQMVSKKIERSGLPVIYVTGGNQGAVLINRAIVEALPGLLKNYFIIHQTGAIDYENVLKSFKILSDNLRDNYLIKSFFPTEEVSWVLNRADFVISRAGANIIYELGILGKPAILIPLPIAGGKEQVKNAELLKNLGLAEIIFQEDLEGNKLVETMKKMFSEYKNYKKASINAGEVFLKNGAKNLISIINEVTKKKKKKL